jgi:hypothetical protein
MSLEYRPGKYSFTSLAPLHFPEIRSMSIDWRPCPARGQGRASRHDEARILSSVRAESALRCADGPAWTAPLCGKEVTFHRIFATRRSCLQTTALSPGHKKRHLKFEGRQALHLPYLPCLSISYFAKMTSLPDLVFIAWRANINFKEGGK